MECPIQTKGHTRESGVRGPRCPPTFLRTSPSLSMAITASSLSEALAHSYAKCDTSLATPEGAAGAGDTGGDVRGGMEGTGRGGRIRVERAQDGGEGT